MLLNVQERVALLNILPEQGNVVTLRLLRELQSELSFTEQEKADIELVQTGNRLGWNTDKEKPKEIEIGATMKEVIVSALKQRDDRKQLHMSHLPLYDKFVVGEV